MGDRFLGITMGVRAAEVEEILQTYSVTGTVRKIVPPLSLAFGLSRKRVLGKASLRMPPYRPSVLVVMGLWSLFGVCLLFTIAAFLLAWSAGAQRIGLATSLATGSLAALGTATALQQVRKEGPDARLVDSDLADAFSWGLMWPGTGTELDLILICCLFVMLVFLFVLYVFWLPLLLVVVSLLTFGQVWREFYGTLVIAVATQARGLSAVGEELLRRHAVLSKSWDLYLTGPVMENSTRSRASHYLVHRLFLATGVLSLVVAGLALADREFPSDLWKYPMAAAIGGAVAPLTVLVLTEHRRRLATSVHK